MHLAWFLCQLVKCVPRISHRYLQIAQSYCKSSTVPSIRQPTEGSQFAQAPPCADSDEEFLEPHPLNLYSSGRKSGALAVKAKAMWKAHEKNPHLHQRPIESDTIPQSNPGASKPRRMYVRPLKQIRKPLSKLTHAVRQVVHAGAVSVFGSTRATRVHDIPCSTVADSRTVQSTVSSLASDSGSSERSAVRVQLQAPDMEGRNTSLGPAATDASAPATPVAEGMDAEDATQVQQVRSIEQHSAPAAPEAHTGCVDAPVCTERLSSEVAPETQGGVYAASHTLAGAQQGATMSDTATTPADARSDSATAASAFDHVVQVAEGATNLPPSSIHPVNHQAVKESTAATPASEQSGVDVAPSPAVTLVQNAADVDFVTQSHVDRCHRFPQDACVSNVDMAHKSALYAQEPGRTVAATDSQQDGAGTGAALHLGSVEAALVKTSAVSPTADEGNPGRAVWQQFEVETSTQQFSVDSTALKTTHELHADMTALPEYVQGGHSFHEARRAVTRTYPEGQVSSTTTQIWCRQGWIQFNKATLCATSAAVTRSDSEML